MPMYFFDVLESNGSVTRDMVGVELDGPERALATASQALLDSVQGYGVDHMNFKVLVIVRDESGQELGRRDATMHGSDGDTPQSY